MELKDIKKVLVAGAGSMGEGIAQNFAQAGLDVRVIDVDEKSLTRCKMQIEANLHLFEEFDLVDEKISSIMGRTEFLKMSKLEEMCDFLDGINFVVEAIPEILELKRDFFSRLDTCREDIILCKCTGRC